MKMEIVRCKFTDRLTLGCLIVDGRFACHTLEPHSIDWSVQPKTLGTTAIRKGTYPVRMLASRKFGRKMPFLTDVPDFEGIMLHAGNTVNDTRGCILCGYKVYRRVNCIYHSHDTVEVLRRLLLAEEASGHGTTVTVCDGRLPRDIKVHPEFAGTMRESGAVKFISE